MQSGLQGKFTTNYVCALAVLNGYLDRACFTDAKVREPKVLEAMSKVNAILDETIPERGEYCPVTILLTDGQKVQYTATIQKGHCKNPLTEAEVLEKFRSNVTVRIPKDQGEKIIACVRRLETLDNVRELTKLLAA